MIKLLIGCLLVSLLIIGCGVTIEVDKADGTKYYYKRRGDQSLENVTFKTPEGAEFSIGKQESTDLQSALNTLDNAIDKIPAMIP